MNAQVTNTSCFTSLEFETDNINGLKFNTTGTDTLIWGANGDDTYVGYHVRNRAKFVLDWETGKANFGDALEPADDDNDDSTSGSSSLGTWKSSVLTGMGLVSAAIYLGL